MFLIDVETYEEVKKDYILSQKRYDEALVDFKLAEDKYEVSDKSDEETKKIDQLAEKLAVLKTKVMEDARFIETLSEPIPKDTFLKFNVLFNSRMQNDNHHHDQAHHYFDKSTLNLVVNNDSYSKVAFVFTTDVNGDFLGASVAGMKDDGSFDIAQMYSSTTKKNGKNRKIEKLKDFKNPMANYKFRMENSPHPFDLTCDRGIYHERGELAKWLEKVESDKVVAYFGIDNKYNDPPLQIIMLVDMKLTNEHSLLNDNEYAFDRGSGCCPGQ